MRFILCKRPPASEGTSFPDPLCAESTQNTPSPAVRLCPAAPEWSVRSAINAARWPHGVFFKCGPHSPMSPVTNKCIIKFIILVWIVGVCCWRWSLKLSMPCVPDSVVVVTSSELNDVNSCQHSVSLSRCWDESQFSCCISWVMNCHRCSHRGGVVVSRWVEKYCTTVLSVQKGQIYTWKSYI